MAALYVLELLISALFVVVVVTQLLIPLSTGMATWPFLRHHLQAREIVEAKDAVFDAAATVEAHRLRQRAEKLKQSITVTKDKS